MSRYEVMHKLAEWQTENMSYEEGLQVLIKGADGWDKYSDEELKEWYDHVFHETIIVEPDEQENVNVEIPFVQEISV
jgi:hypothetical protein